MTYNGKSYDVIKPDGYPAYRGPLKRAKLWARVFGGRIEEVV